MGHVPYTYKGAKRYGMNFSNDQSAHQAKSVYFLQSLPRNYLPLKLLRALNLLSRTLLAFPSYMNISDYCSYFWSTTLANSWGNLNVTFLQKAFPVKFPLTALALLPLLSKLLVMLSVVEHLLPTGQ